jgi:hypothetical protein
MLSSLTGEYLPDTIRSGKLGDGSRQESLKKRRSNILTAIFLIAGCAMISLVSLGVFSTDMGTKLRTPGGRPA